MLHSLAAARLAASEKIRLSAALTFILVSESALLVVLGNNFGFIFGGVSFPLFVFLFLDAGGHQALKIAQCDAWLFLALMKQRGCVVVAVRIVNAADAAVLFVPPFVQLHRFVGQPNPIVQLLRDVVGRLLAKLRNLLGC